MWCQMLKLHRQVELVNTCYMAQQFHDKHSSSRAKPRHDISVSDDNPFFCLSSALESNFERHPSGSSTRLQTQLNVIGPNHCCLRRQRYQCRMCHSYCIRIGWQPQVGHAWPVAVLCVWSLYSLINSIPPSSYQRRVQLLLLLADVALWGPLMFIQLQRASLEK